MDEKLDRALLKVIHGIASKFGPSAVLKGGMSLRLQGIPRSTVDADFSFKPFKKKTPFSKDLLYVMNALCDREVSYLSDSKEIQVSGMVEGVKVVVEASAHAKDFEPQPMDTTFLSSQYNLPAAVVSVMPNGMGFSNKLGAWFDRRLSRDLYDIYVYYEILKSEPDQEILKERILKPNFVRLVKSRPKLNSIELFLELLREECEAKGETQIELELEGIIEERERKGVGKRILTTINRMVL